MTVSLHTGDAKNEAGLCFFLGKRVINSKEFLLFSLIPVSSLGKLTLKSEEAFVKSLAMCCVYLSSGLFPFFFFLSYTYLYKTKLKLTSMQKLWLFWWIKTEIIHVNTTNFACLQQLPTLFHQQPTFSTGFTIKDLCIGHHLRHLK